MGISTPNLLYVTATLTSATWNTAATHEVFIVTGVVRAKLWVVCTATLTDAADAARIQFGDETTTNSMIAVTAGASAGASLIATGVLWYDATPDLLIANYSTAVFDKVINGLDIGYEVSGAAFTGGSLVFGCEWQALSAGASVVAGAGGVLA
jgi:hypothetical protein